MSGWIFRIFCDRTIPVIFGRVLSVLLLTIDIDHTAMALDDTMDKRQAKTSSYTYGFRREKRIKDFLDIIRINAVPCITDG